MAAKAGTIIKPPENAKSAKSIAACIALDCEKYTTISDESWVICSQEGCKRAKARSQAERAMSKPPIDAGIKLSCVFET